jgi:hypothetical protein
MLMNGNRQVAQWSLRAILIHPSPVGLIPWASDLAVSDGDTGILRLLFRTSRNDIPLPLLEVN